MSLQLSLVYFLACCPTHTTGSGSCQFCLTRGRNVGSAQPAGLVVCCLARRRNTRHTGTALWVGSSGSANRCKSRLSKSLAPCPDKATEQVGLESSATQRPCLEVGRWSLEPTARWHCRKEHGDTKCPITRGQFWVEGERWSLLCLNSLSFFPLSLHLPPHSRLLLLSGRSAISHDSWN